MRGGCRLVRKGMLWRNERARGILRLACHGVLRISYKKSGVGMCA